MPIGESLPTISLSTVCTGLTCGLGWQMEFPENAWAALPGSGKEASYAGCFRRIVQAMRQEQPANQWKLVFNVTDIHWRALPGSSPSGPATLQVTSSALLPTTVLDPRQLSLPKRLDAGCRLTRQQNSWNHKFWGLVALRNFAAAHGGKPLAFPEWGLLVRSDGRGGGDNPYFVEKMREFFMDPANNVVFHAYTNTSRQYYDSRLTDPTAKTIPAGRPSFPIARLRLRASLAAQRSPSVAFTAPAAGATISGSFSGSNGCEVTGTGIIATCMRG